MRKLQSWLDGFESFTDGKGSPKIFSKWAGIFAIASALERRVWIKTAKGILYPNMYTITVGPPGAGKTLALAIARSMLEELPDIHIAPTSVTKASLIDALNLAKRDIIRPIEGHIHYNALTVTSDELGVFLPAYENDFMNTLTNIYDCRIYSETRRTKDLKLKIENPMLNLAAATTPSYLNALLPEGAWDQGFLSRTMLIYSGAEAPGDLFFEADANTELQRNLVHDLKDIGRMYGKMAFTEEAAQAINSWHKSGGLPLPDHPKLAHYNTRRTAHLLKLCMVAAASNHEFGDITLDDYAEAMNWMIEAEAAIPDIFKSMRNGGDARVIEDAYYFVYKAYLPRKQLVSEARLFNFLQERTPVHNVERIVMVMERAGLLIKEYLSTGMFGYKPGEKREA